MKITEAHTRVVQWEGKTTLLPPHFCTNPMDLVMFREASMGNFAFHGLTFLIGRITLEGKAQQLNHFNVDIPASKLPVWGWLGTNSARSLFEGDD